MSPRRRSSKRRDWPANLYEREGYFSWRDPRTREETGLGRISRTEAFAQAIEANLYVAKLLNKPRLIDQLTGEADRSIGAWLEKYETILDARDPPLAANTRKSYRSLSKRTRETWDPKLPVRTLNALMVSEQLEKLAAMPRLAQAWRSFLRDSFREAIVRGWLDENPVRGIKGAVVTVKRARLEFDVLQRAYDSCTVPWLRNAIALALVGAQRREDIVLAKVKDFRERAWWIDQGKTGSRIVIPFDLRLNVFGMSLGEVYQQCRATGVLSPYLIHQTGRYGNSEPGARIFKDTLSKRFSELVARLEIDWGDKSPPTFHEIRSLSERLYGAQGGVNTQELLGHKDPRSTQLYHDARGAWVRLKISNE